MGGDTGPGTFDLDWTGNLGMLTTSPLARTGTEAKENAQSQGARSRKQRPVQAGNISAKLGTDRSQVLREQSNIGLVQASGSNWKAVKAQACDLESKGQLQAALNLINEAMKQADQPSHEMLQYQSDMKFRINAAGQLNKQAVRMAIHRPCGGAEDSQNSDMCTPSISAFPQALSFDSQNLYGTTGGVLHANPASISSKAPESITTPVLPRAEASITASTPDSASSNDHVGIGASFPLLSCLDWPSLYVIERSSTHLQALDSQPRVPRPGPVPGPGASSDGGTHAGVRIQPGMQAATPVLQLTQSTEDTDVLVDGDALAAITKSVGGMVLNAEDGSTEPTASGHSGDSTPMRGPGKHGSISEGTQLKGTNARCNSVRFSQMEPVAVTRSPLTPDTVSPACGDAMQSKFQDAGHTPYSAMTQSHVTFADQTVNVSEETPVACNSRESLLSPESPDIGDCGPLEDFRSLNAGATPRHCHQSHVKFCPSMPEVAPASSAGDVLPATPDGEGIGELSADESRHLSMNAGCTPGAGRLSCGAGPAQAAGASSMEVTDNMRTDSGLVAGPLQLDGTMPAPAATARNHAPGGTGSSAVAACLTFKSDAVQGTAPAQRCTVTFADSEALLSATLAGQDSTTTPAVLGAQAKPNGGLKWPAQQSGLRSSSSVEPASAPPVAGALFRTPAQGTSSLVHDNMRTAGGTTVGMRGSEAGRAFDIILENSFSSESPDGLAACQSTPTLHGASSYVPVRSPSSGTPVAGGCLTAVGKREGTPAFGAVDGIDDDPGSCTGTDCSMTPELSCVEDSAVRTPGGASGDGHAVSGSAGGKKTTAAAAAAAGERAPRVSIAVNQEEVSSGDTMISPCWLQSEADAAKSATCADGVGGFGSPVGPSAPWTGFDAMHAASEASTPSLARESATSRSPATLSMKGGASSSSQTPPSQLAHATKSTDVLRSTHPTTCSTADTAPSEAMWAHAGSLAGFYDAKAGLHTPETAAPRGTPDLLRESPDTDELLQDTPSPRPYDSAPVGVSCPPMSPPSPLQHTASVAPSTSASPGGQVPSESPQVPPSPSTSPGAQVSSECPQVPPDACVCSPELPMSPGAMAIVVAAGLAAGSPMARTPAAAHAPGSLGSAAVAVEVTPKATTPGVKTRTAVGLGKLRTPGRRELKAILADPVAQDAVEALKGENDVCFATARADSKQQRKHQSETVLTPVRRSRRSQAHVSVPLTDKLNETSWTYSPNPALTNRALSRAQEDLLESLAQLNVQDK